MLPGRGDGGSSQGEGVHGVDHIGLKAPQVALGDGEGEAPGPAAIDEWQSKTEHLADVETLDVAACADYFATGFGCDQHHLVAPPT